MKALIVGAGVAGITSGHILSERGIDFRILEATSVHGGRLRKAEDFVDFPIDLGAEWIHTWIRAKPALLADLLQGTDREHPTFKYRPRTVAIARNGTLRQLNFLRFLSYVPDYKFVDSSWFDVFDELVTPSLRERIHFESPVEEIHYGGDKVVVTTGTGTIYEADKVLVTVPVALLQQGAIRFEPPLPAQQMSAINDEEMPGGLKVFIEFSEKFYPDLVSVGGLLRRPRGECSYYDAALNKNSTHHVLGLFAQGQAAEPYLTQGDDDAIFQYVLGELDELFDRQASQLYIQHLVQNWSAEPYIRGSYSQRKSSARRMAAPVADRVYFAGEAMNPNGKTIAVHGACESAYASIETMLSHT